ncbi:Unknown protein sequence [Pseudomonas syringae pv. maculicola str. M6]|nr:Unknown protein sequence [Pseudomonas syringae pv. maculicola str. M6]
MRSNNKDIIRQFEKSERIVFNGGDGLNIITVKCRSLDSLILERRF